MAGNGFLTERGLDIAAVVKDIAAELGTTPSRVALARTLLNPAVTAPIAGASSPAQLDDNLGPSTSGSIPRSRPGWPR
jgi:aryl-alcohol dehydrogenase-like predicted oxidoreductase